MYVHNLDSILWQAGIITIRWYGLLFAGGIIAALLVSRWLFKREKLDLELLYSLSFYLIIGLIIGARLGYVLFYNLDYFIVFPQEIIKIWKGGLSSHGATLGLLLVYILFYITHKKQFKNQVSRYTDLMVISFPLVALGVRLGNFINGEIVGRVSQSPWSVYFNGESVARHPVQLYEALLLFIIFWILLVLKRIKIPYFITFAFVLLYFGGRFFLEYTKEYQYADTGLTTGQVLSVFPIIISLGYLIKLLIKK